MNVSEQFPRGSYVRTTARRYLLKGQTERFGRVAGYCERPNAMRVTWDGWQPTSSVAVMAADFERRQTEIVAIQEASGEVCWQVLFNGRQTRPTFLTEEEALLYAHALQHGEIPEFTEEASHG